MLAHLIGFPPVSHNVSTIMVVYAYVETFYDVNPPPQGWQGGAYTPFNRRPNHTQLSQWAGGALQWSRTNLQQALANERPPRTYDHRKWRQANPVIRDTIPPNTPRYTPRAEAFSEILEASEEGEEDLVVVDDEGKEV
ncbi:hypothetical protein NLJ89_g4168 [Agrocybe chaxingu]|uniref:Uncharacterized protein n=1 Tax=Agrocybe chaxingu TaxID=84603 RepID=A0A9W8MW72_9AGAR|nr:hypothetical protein NLJ89_g4168 [Agrocybe chaxingu]